MGSIETLISTKAGMLDCFYWNDYVIFNNGCFLLGVCAWIVTAMPRNV